MTLTNSIIFFTTIKVASYDWYKIILMMVEAVSIKIILLQLKSVSTISLCTIIINNN